MIHQHERQHRLGDRRGADADAGIVAPVRNDLDRLAEAVDRATRQADAGGGLQRDLATMSCPQEMPPRMPPELFERKPCGRDLVAVRGALLLHGREAGADLHALHRVDAHHRVRDVGVEAVEDGLAQPGGSPLATTLMRAPMESPALMQRLHVGLQLRHHAASGQKKGLVSTCPSRARRRERPELREIAAHRDAEPLAQVFLGDRAGGDPQRGLARRGAAAAAVIAETVFLLVGVIGVIRPEACP